jgi:hypothetical protein
MLITEITNPQFISESHRRRLCEEYRREATNLYEEFARIAVKNKFTQQQIKEIFEAAATAPAQPAAAPGFGVQQTYSRQTVAPTVQGSSATRGSPTAAPAKIQQPGAGQKVVPTTQGQVAPTNQWSPALQQQLAKATQFVQSAEAKLSASIQNAQGAIANFDQQFEQVKAGWAKQYPKLNAAIEKLREVGERNEGLQEAIIFILQTVAGAAGMAFGGPIGAGVAVGILTTGINLLQGKAASSSIARGAVSGVAGAVLSAGAHEIEHALHAAGGMADAAITGIEKIAHVAVEKGAGAAAGSAAGQAIGAVAKAAVKNTTGVQLE